MIKLELDGLKMTQCIELILLWEWGLVPKWQLSSQSPPAYIWSQGSFFPTYIIYLILIRPLTLYHKVFLTSFLMPSLILATPNTFMYWQTIISHCSSPFPDCCWTKKMSAYKLLKSSTDDFPSHLLLLSFHQLFIHTRIFFFTLLILKLQSKYNKLCRGKKIKICQTDHAHKHPPADIVHADFWNSKFLQKVKEHEIFDFSNEVAGANMV